MRSLSVLYFIYVFMYLLFCILCIIIMYLFIMYLCISQCVSLFFNNTEVEM